MSDLAQTFAALSRTGKSMVLARVIQMETIHARDAFSQSPPGVEAMHEASELTHRLSGYIMMLLAGDDLPGQDGSVFEMMRAATQARGPRCVTELATWLQEAQTL